MTSIVAAMPNFAFAQQYVIDQCQQVGRDSEPASAERALDPAGWVGILASTKQHLIDPGKVNVTLIRGPQHGKLRQEVASTGYRFFAYDPAPHYLGRETITFDAVYRGVTYRVKSTVAVVVMPDDHEDQKVCPEARMRKVGPASAL